MKNANRFPDGWNEDRVRRLLDHHKSQTGDEAVSEDEAVLVDSSQTSMAIPKGLVPSVQALLAQRGE